MENEFKIKINSDSQGNKISLDDITIEAAEALKTFISSLTQLANKYDNISDFKIALSDGCVESCLKFPKERGYIIREIDAVIEGKSRDNELIKVFKGIQDSIKLNGLDFSVFLNDNNLTPQFKGKEFSYIRQREEAIKEVVFLKGRLFEAGGKKTTNIHIQDGEFEYKINCTVDEAIELNSFLYKDIFLSTVRTSKRHRNPEYNLLDFYNNFTEFEYFSSFFNKIVRNDKLERYDLLHDKLYELIMDENIIFIKKFIKIFNKSFDRGVLRTILMTLKPVIKKDSFNTIRPSYITLSESLRVGSSNNKI